MVILFDAAKLQQLFDICKYFCNYFYFYGDFFAFFSVIQYVKYQSIYHLVIWLFCNHAGDQTRMAYLIADS